MPVPNHKRTDLSGMQVVILCGGKGTRSYPFTEYYPKPMMPIRGTPILVHLMKIYAEQGITSFVLAAGHRKEMLHDYFEGRFQQWDIRIVDTGENADTGERILNCSPYLTNTFFATYGDGLGNVDLAELLEFYQRSGGMAAVTSVPLRSQYGTVEFDQANRVRRFIEKPVIAEYRINAGFFVFDAHVFEHWKGKNLETEVLPALADEGMLYTYFHNGFWRSMDTSKDQQELEKLVENGIGPWQQLARSRV